MKHSLGTVLILTTLALGAGSTGSRAAELTFQPHLMSKQIEAIRLELEQSSNPYSRYSVESVRAKLLRGHPSCSSLSEQLRLFLHARLRSTTPVGGVLDHLEAVDDLIETRTRPAQAGRSWQSFRTQFNSAIRYDPGSFTEKPAHYGRLRRMARSLLESAQAYRGISKETRTWLARELELLSPRSVQDLLSNAPGNGPWSAGSSIASIRDLIARRISSMRILDRAGIQLCPGTGSPYRAAMELVSRSGRLRSGVASALAAVALIGACAQVRAAAPSPRPTPPPAVEPSPAAPAREGPVEAVPTVDLEGLERTGERTPDREP